MGQGYVAAFCCSMVNLQFIEGSYALMEMQWEGSKGPGSYSRLHPLSACLLVLALASWELSFLLEIPQRVSSSNVRWDPFLSPSSSPPGTCSQYAIPIERGRDQMSKEGSSIETERFH
jgi:hypothetical protein